MERLSRSKLQLSVLSVLVILCLSAPTYAAETGGIGGRPANPRADNLRTESIFVHEMQPGQTVKDAIVVYNNTPDKKTILVYPTDSVMSSGGAFACAQAADPIKEVGGWITLAKKQIILDSGQNETVAFTITAPEDAQPGEWNGCIAIQQADASATNVGNGIALSFRSAIRVAITMPGEITKNLTFQKVALAQKTNKLVGTIWLRNNGNVSLDASVETKVTGIFGISNQAIKGTYPALPKTTTELNFEYNKPSWGGLYRLQASAAYNAKVSESLGEGQNTATTTGTSRYIFVLPKFGPLVIELAILAALGFAIWKWAHRRYNMPKLAASFEPYTVKKGDDIQTIAVSHSISWKKLAQVNGIKPPFSLKKGDVIRVPKLTQAPESTVAQKNADVPLAQAVDVTTAQQDNKKKSSKPTSKKTTSAVAKSKKKTTKTSTKKNVKKEG